MFKLLVWKSFFDIVREMKKYNTKTAEIDLHFQYPIKNDPRLAKLKHTSGIKLDTTKDELNKTKDVIGYVHSLFTHDGDNVPSSADPLTILKEAKTGQSFRCVEYSTLATGLLWANGIPTRTIGLKTSDVEIREYGAGHVVIEFWSKDLNKWVMSDVQAGIIPEQNATPLSTYELSQVLDQGQSVTYVPVTNSRFSQDSTYDDKVNYSDWIKDYLYFIDTPVKLTLGNEDKRKQQIAMLIPIEAKPPIMFQRAFKMNAVYTHSVLDFYPKI
jgi:hypothetical protein